jgi:hypothetical protein
MGRGWPAGASAGPGARARGTGAVKRWGWAGQAWGWMGRRGMGWASDQRPRQHRSCPMLHGTMHACACMCTAPCTPTPPHPPPPQQELPLPHQHLLVCPTGHYYLLVLGVLPPQGRCARAARCSAGPDACMGLRHWAQPHRCMQGMCMLTTHQHILHPPLAGEEGGHGWLGRPA